MILKNTLMAWGIMLVAAQDTPTPPTTTDPVVVADPVTTPAKADPTTDPPADSTFDDSFSDQYDLSAFTTDAAGKKIASDESI